MVNQQRIIENFLELVQIDSETGNERAIADFLKQRLLDLGLEVEEDNAAELTGGNSGNLIAYLPGKTKGPQILLAAHMDTVQPGRNIRPQIIDGVISSQGATILGADDKAGIAAILEMLKVLEEQQIRHINLQIIFTVAEEGGLWGAKNLKPEDLPSDFAFVLDSSGPPGKIIIEGPAQNSVHAVVRGKKAHAGVEPEMGINAIQIAARALARMKLGRIDQDTTANIGLIKGGIATNIIPDQVVLEGEVRSLVSSKLEKQIRHMEECFQRAGEELGGTALVTIEPIYPEIKLQKTEPVVQLAIAAAKNMNMPFELAKTGGGSDANILNSYLPTVNLGCGMTNVHTTEEYITVQDLVSNAEYLIEIVKEASK